MIRWLLAAFLVAANAMALDLGPVRTAVASIGRCPDPKDRCLVAATSDSGHVLLWAERSAGRVRIRSTSGATVFDLVEDSSAAQPTLASDGRSYLATWRTGSAPRFTIRAARLTSEGAPEGNRLTIDRSSVTAQALWTGMQFAVVLPASIVSLTEGDQTRTVGLETTATSIQVVAARSGNSILAVRELRTPFRCSGFSMPTCWGGEYYATATLIGARVGESQQVIENDSVPRAAFSLVAEGDGYLLMWWERQILYALRLDQAGRSVGSKNMIAAVREPGTTSVLPTRDGWVVAWDDRGVHVAELDASGARIGAPVNVATDAVSPVLLKVAENRFRLFYRGVHAIEERLVATGGETVEPPRRRSVR